MSRVKEASENSGLHQAVHHFGEEIADIGVQARDAAKAKLHDLREHAGEYVEHGKERAKEWEHSLEEYVQEKPLQSLLMAAGAGLLLGYLWKRR